MNKEQIIETLKSAAKPYESYYIEDEVRQAMSELSDPADLLEPILEIIGTNPTVNFGSPGELVHFAERFYKKGYEELLIASVRRNPTAHNIWMVHRCYNDMDNPLHQSFLKLIQELAEGSAVSEEVKETINAFSW